tara:strand:- start:689 stop:1645 length:957 start_codon:yes stop_codon:yes gene_type:complete
MVRQEMWGSYGTQAEGETAKEVCANAGVDWDAQIGRLFDSEGTMLTQKHRGVFRQDTGDCIGVVGKSYVVKQHHEVAELAHRLTETSHLNWNTVGVVGNGEKAWFNLELPDEVVINGNEPIQSHMTLMNSHDGSSGIRVVPGCIRQACGNQMNMILATARKVGNLFTVRHTKNMDEMIEQMISAIGMTNTLLDEWAESASEMMKVEMDTKDGIEFYLDVLPFDRNEDRITADNPHGLATRGNNILDSLLDLETQEQNQIGDMDGTLWQKVNVVTDYIDHDWITTQDGKANLKRAESAFIGTGQRHKRKAWATALDLLV